jgi:hypothetical protein
MRDTPQTLELLNHAPEYERQLMQVSREQACRDAWHDDSTGRSR